MGFERLDEPQLTPKQEHYMELENQCCLCGTELVFEHVQEESGEKLIEKAHCPCCKVHLKETEHSIQ